jgi:cytochrome c-type biogenesis protein CcmE
MTGRKAKYLIGAAIIVVAVGGLIYSGVKESVVYFYTPTEITAQSANLSGKALRVGGMVADGSVRWDPQTLQLTFALTDGQGTVAVRHKGTAPDLFKEGAGAVVEGTWSPEGYFRSSTIMAKHSEEYKPPAHPETLESKKATFQSLQKEEKK